ncbi:hypothetical protein tb265_12740 [Gemmatimonadetes bacterium T265]|nr:hypothetical protein tb265_12740 [Gemmatimonadetes bacterium T265]
MSSPPAAPAPVSDVSSHLRAAPSPAARAPAASVPAALSSFVGRAREVASVRAALEGARLLTLTGPGGAGKTRLAREVAAALAEERLTQDVSAYPDGVWWVELAPLVEGGELPGAVATVLGVRLASDHAAAAAIAEALRDGRALLVLDNCEHVVAAAAAFADGLLRACPGVTVLATSREALAVEGEVAWVVPPLAHPPRADRAYARGGDPPATSLGATAADVGAYDAVRLFVERARSASPAFGLTDRNAGAVAAICARLDGIPLALELAAAQVATFGVEPLAAQLDDALAVLARGGRRAGPARHQTLRALLDWSYALLGDAERRLLDRLSVFRNAATLDAVVAVCGQTPPAGGSAAGAADPALFASLGRLVEQSLVDVRDAGEEVRYALLETVRQYGAARLVGTAEEVALRDRHLAWAGDFMTRAEPRLWSSRWIEEAARLTAIMDDLRAAVAWAARAADPSPAGAARATDALRVVGPLVWYWAPTGGFDDAVTLLEAAFRAAVRAGVADDGGGRRLTPTPEASAVARRALTAALTTWNSLAALRNALGDAVPADHLIGLWDAECAAAAEAGDAARCGALQKRSFAKNGQSEIALIGGDAVAARALGEGVVADAHASGDPRAIAFALGRHGFVLGALGDHAAGAAELEEGATRWAALGDGAFLALTRQSQAEHALATGDAFAAAAHARAGLAAQRGLFAPWLLARGLEIAARALVAAATDAAASAGGGPALGAAAAGAARVLGAADGERRRAGTVLPDFDRAGHEQAVAAAAAALGTEAFRDSWAAGARLTGDAAIDDAWAAPWPTPPAPIAPGADARPAAGEGLTPAPTAAGRAGGTLTLRVLGPPALARDAAAPAEPLPGSKVAELLLWLVLHPAGTKEQIGLDLWPDASAAQLRSNFHFTLHHLRRLLGDRGWVAQDGGRYRLARAVADGGAGDAVRLSCDADDLFATAEVLRAAARHPARGGRGAPPDATRLDDAALVAARGVLDACGGELADGLTTADWLERHRARARSAWEDGMAVVAHALAAAGRHAEALAAYEAVLARDPLREAAHRAVMAVHAAAGEPGRALAHYDALAARLAREMGARPARETQALAERIRGGP